jgi:hypothetical protein
MSTQLPTSTQIVHKGKKILVYSYKGNSNKLGPVGYTYEGEKTYYSRRRPLHFFRIFNGYGMSMDVYNEIVKREVEIVILYYEDNMYESKLSQWKHSSRWDNEILKTEKIDPQYILELSEMKYMKGGIENEMENENQEDLGNVGPVQSSSVDLVKYDKQVTVIEKSEITQLPSQFTAVVPGTNPPLHYMQWILRVSSVVLESIREGEDKIEFRASEIFNLTQNDQGKLTGFPTTEKSKLMKFLKDLKIPEPEKFQKLKDIQEAIKGKKAVIKAETKEKDGRTNTYLRFRY